MALLLEKIPSLHSSDRRGHPIRATVIHYTAGGSGKASAQWFSDPQSRVSAHFIVDRDGKVYQCVEIAEAAWHTGAAELVIDGEAYSQANSMSIGIELANAGLCVWNAGRWCYQVGDSHLPLRWVEPVHGILEYDDGQTVQGYWEPYPDQQIDALQELLACIAATYPEAAQNLVGHEEIAIPLGRKSDPGPLFPWERFSRRMHRRTKGTKKEGRRSDDTGPHPGVHSGGGIGQNPGQGESSE